MFFIKFKTTLIDDIREEVKKIIPVNFTNSTKLDYVNGHRFNTEIILSLISIKKLLFSMNLTSEDVALCGFTVCLPHQEIKLHADRGIYRLSMNIPITEATGTFVNFYKTISEPIEIVKGRNIYYSFKEEDCQLAEVLETDTPSIIDTKIPHRVINNTDFTRVMLLIRFKNSIDFSKFSNLV